MAPPSNSPAPLTFVFGGTRGIGAALVKQLLERSHEVVVFARSYDALLPADAFFYALDLTDSVSCRSVVEAAIAQHGVPIYAIDCVGGAKSQYFSEHSLDDFEEQIWLNYLSAVNISKIILPHMAEHREGRLIFVGSMLSLFSHAGFSAYAPAKRALCAFAECLRLEYSRRGVSISLYCPPSTDTPGFAEENRLKPTEILSAELRGGLLSDAQVAWSLIKRLDTDRFIILPNLRCRLIVAAARYLPFWIWHRMIAIRRDK